MRIVTGAALEALVDLQDELLRLGGWLKLAHANALLQEVFQFTGIADYVSYVDGSSGQSSARLPVLLAGPRKFGDLLLARGLLTQEQIDEALALQQRTRRAPRQDHRGERLGIRARSS